MLWHAGLACCKPARHVDSNHEQRLKPEMTSRADQHTKAGNQEQTSNTKINRSLLWKPMLTRRVTRVVMSSVAACKQLNSRTKRPQIEQTAQE